MGNRGKEIPVGARQLVRNHEPVLALPQNRTRNLGVVGRTEFIPFLRRRSIGSLKRNQRNGKHGMNSVLRRSHLGVLASWCATMGKLGWLRPPKMAACHPSCPAHELANAREFPCQRETSGRVSVGFSRDNPWRKTGRGIMDLGGFAHRFVGDRRRIRGRVQLGMIQS